MYLIGHNKSCRQCPACTRNIRCSTKKQQYCTALSFGYIPVIVKDACGFGHRDAADRSIASLEFAGDALLTNADTLMCSTWIH